MKALDLHRWDVTPAEAREIQLRLRERVERGDRLGNVRHVAGADLALELRGRGSWRTGEARAIAGVIVYRFPEMEEVERASAIRPLQFPYVPGLLSFREIPALLAAFESLRISPDLIFCDGQGYAHPRRFGLAAHLGVLLDTPTVGVAKSLLIGECREPGRAAGSTSALIDASSASSASTGEQIGAALRTASGVKPVYVSTGNRISLARAIEFTLTVADGFRIPRPTREADHFVNELRRKRKALAAGAGGAKIT